MADANGWGSGSNVDIINNIAVTMIPIQHLVSGFSYILGLAFAFKAIATLKQYGESKTMMSSSANMKEPMIYLLVAAMCLYFPTALGIIINTAFGSQQGGNILATPVSNSSLFGSTVGRSLALIIQTIGGIAFVRGWVLIARASSQGQQPGGTGKGLVHIFGGILAMNIVLTLQVINNTLYGS